MLKASPCRECVVGRDRCRQGLGHQNHSIEPERGRRSFVARVGLPSSVDVRAVPAAIAVFSCCRSWGPFLIARRLRGLCHERSFAVANDTTSTVWPALLLIWSAVMAGPGMNNEYRGSNAFCFAVPFTCHPLLPVIPECGLRTSTMTSRSSIDAEQSGADH